MGQCRLMNAFCGIPGWSAAVIALKQALTTHGAETRDRAERYGREYSQRRAAMVFDVVASRQRRYRSRVLPMVAEFEKTPASASLLDLSRKAPKGNFGLRTGEAETMQEVAAGLVRYGSDNDLKDDESIIASWALDSELFVFASKLEPYVGSVHGIGGALFAYLRMRCGANAIKPDVRVYKALQLLGLPVPREDNAIILTCQGLSDELGISALELDQLLWNLGQE